MEDQTQPNAPAAPPTNENPWVKVIVPAGSPPPPAEPSAPAGGGEQTAPEPVGPLPADPFRPDYSPDEWQALAEQTRLDVRELQTVLPAAREVMHNFAPSGLIQALEAGDPELSGFDADPAVYQALASVRHDLKTYTDAEARMVTELEGLARERGEPFKRPSIPPLRGEALEQAVQQLMARRLPDPGARQRLANGFLTHRLGRATVENIAQAEHRLVQSLSAMEKQKRAWQSQQEGRAISTPVSNRPSSNQPQVSKEDLRLQYDEMFLEWHEAKQAGNSLKAEVLNRKLSRLAPKVFGR